MDTLELLKSGKAIIIDVRSQAEYSGGHVSGSLNIPLNEIEARAEEIKAHNRPVILCCASGMRSMQATSILTHKGVPNCYNGGSWIDVNYYRNH